MASTQILVSAAALIRDIPAGMHWGTWVLTDEEMTEPPQRLAKAAAKRGLAPGDFVTLNIGETLRIRPASS